MKWNNDWQGEKQKEEFCYTWSRLVYLKCYFSDLGIHQSEHYIYTQWPNKGSFVFIKYSQSQHKPKLVLKPKKVASHDLVGRGIWLSMCMYSFAGQAKETTEEC